jgi:hypothetical protein
VRAALLRGPRPDNRRDFIPAVLQVALVDHAREEPRALGRGPVA